LNKFTVKSFPVRRLSSHLFFVFVFCILCNIALSFGIETRLRTVGFAILLFVVLCSDKVRRTTYDV